MNLITINNRGTIEGVGGMLLKTSELRQLLNAIELTLEMYKTEEIVDELVIDYNTKLMHGN
jgi:glycogen synthase